MLKIIAFISIFILELTDQVPSVHPPPHVVDKNTGEELSVATKTYYMIRNRSTGRYLIWFGKCATVGESDSYASKTGKYYHTFVTHNESWYKMNHQFGSHLVKLASSHETGYFNIYDANCNDGENPISDTNDDSGKVKCDIIENDSEYTIMDWIFTEKEKT